MGRPVTPLAMSEATKHCVISRMVLYPATLWGGEYGGKKEGLAGPVLRE